VLATYLISVLIPLISPVVGAVQGDPNGRIADSQVDRRTSDTDNVKNLILKLFDNSDPNAQVAAARSLGKLKDPQAWKALVEMALHGSSKEVRAESSKALSRVRSPEAEDLLASALGDPNDEVSGAAMEAMKVIGDTHVVDLLSKKLADPQYVAADQAVKALGSIKDPRSIPALATLLASGASSGSQTGISTSIDDAAEVLGEFKDERAEDALIKALTYENLTLRTTVERVLAKSGDQRARDAVFKALAVAQYHDNNDGFSISPPSGWITGDPRVAMALVEAVRKEFSPQGEVDYEALNRIDVVIFNPADKSGSQNINVLSVPVHLSVDDDNLDQIRAQLWKLNSMITVKSLRRAKFGRNDGIIADEESSDGKSHLWQVFLPAGRKTLIVTCTAPAETFEGVSLKFEAAISSMEIPNGWYLPDLPEWATGGLKRGFIGALVGGVFGFFVYIFRRLRSGSD
jgi:HEAT repeat protein